MKKRHSAFVVVSTTLDTKPAAATLAARIVEERLAACVQQLPIHSVYRWKGSVEQASECLLLAKTRRDLAPRLITFIRKHHSYELPEIVVTPILGGLPAYLRWIAGETAPPPRPRTQKTP